MSGKDRLLAPVQPRVEPASTGGIAFRRALPFAALLLLLCAAHTLLETARDGLFLTQQPISRLPFVFLAVTATVLALKPDHSVLKTLTKVGDVGPHPEGGECRFEVRFFAAPIGINEDPVTGSLNANIAHWLIDTGRAPASRTCAAASNRS